MKKQSMIMALAMMLLSGAFLTSCGELTEVQDNPVSPELPMKATPLTFLAKGTGSIKVNFGVTLPKPITYTKNGGAETSITTTTSIEVAAGDEVCFFSKNSALAHDQYDYVCFNTTADCDIYGNVMSMIDDEGNGFENDVTIGAPYALSGLFAEAGQINIHSTKELLLPATTITEGCYDIMFRRCTSLTKTPELPATTLAKDCYSFMFWGCSNLTSAPALPATTLAERCYEAMFMKCYSLTTAPELPAATLTDHCYSAMFDQCSSLNYVKCLATDISAENCLDFWLYEVAEKGTFVKAASMQAWPKGSDGIPSSWTITDCTE